MPRFSKKDIILTAGMVFESPWLGKGTIVKFETDPHYGTMVHVLWDQMGIVQEHLEDAIIHEVWLEKKNIERLTTLAG